jgi:hypothetical protein
LVYALPSWPRLFSSASARHLVEEALLRPGRLLHEDVTFREPLQVRGEAGDAPASHEDAIGRIELDCVVAVLHAPVRGR